MNNVLGMKSEIAKEHEKLRSLDSLIELARKEERELTREEVEEGMRHETNLLRIRLLPENMCIVSRNSNGDDRIDDRYQRVDKIPLICNKCGAVFSTKNIEKIGARSIFPFFGRGNKHDCSYTFLAETCSDGLSALRLATDDEIAYLKGVQE